MRRRWLGLDTCQPGDSPPLFGLFLSSEIHARDACEADGATVATAMAAFNAENPGTAVTAAALVDKRNGGPYLQNWPYNPAYYRYSIKAGILRLNLLKSVGPPFVYSKSTVYKGPRSCKDVEHYVAPNWS